MSPRTGRRCSCSPTTSTSRSRWRAARPSTSSPTARRPRWRAREAAGDASISVAGGASTIDQFLALGLLDELRLHIAPLVLGAGERLFAASGPIDLQPIASRTASLVTHVTYRVRGHAH